MFTQSVTGYLSKPPKLLFNILLLGRFFTIACKEWVYGICETTGFLVAFYGAISGYCVYSIIQFRRSGTNRKLFFLFFLFGAVTLGFLIPLPFPGAALLVFYDRYTYFANAFVYILPAILLGKYLKGWPVYTILTIYLGINVFFTLRLNRYWKHSAYINNRLYNEMPAASGKTILLLNLPENLNGVPMIGAQPESEFKSLHDLFTGIEIKNKIYDVQSFNLMTKEDGAHISVINDSTIKVTLNQWGTWWWFEGHGGTSYENADFKLDLVDPGHWYQLTLKRPSNQYQLLFLNSTSWKTVNMSRLNEDQY
ncbi:MAG: hypothetical protein H7257_14935 [Taibaiella sp.]|nr:hypothetical protein [Taibaiella sp.]